MPARRNLCHTCHRKDLGGLVGPNLTDEFWRHGCSVDEMVQNVTTGFPPKGMLPFGSTQRLTDKELLQVVSYVISKHNSNPNNPKAIDPELDKLYDEHMRERDPEKRFPNTHELVAQLQQALYVK